MDESSAHEGEPLALAHREDFRLGMATVRPSLRTVEGRSGAAKAEPRVMQVLVALADARGQVLTREDLLRLCWNGRLVGDDAINRAVAEVRRIAETVDGGFKVETVARVGYRLTSVPPDIAEVTLPSVADHRPDKARRRFIVGGLAGLTAVSAGAGAILYSGRNRNVDALVERGRQLQASGTADDLRRAETVFQEAAKLNPKRADAWGWLAVVTNDKARAKEAAERAVSLDPREPHARTVLAFLQRDLNSWTQWEDALLAILADAPDTAPALSHLTIFYQAMGRCRDSLLTNEQVIRIEPLNVSHQCRRALKHWIFGRLADADRVADRALELWPRNPLAWNARMLIYASTGRAPAALALLDDNTSRPVNMTPPNIASWRAGLKALATRAHADIADAVRICTEAASLAPGIAANAIMLLSHVGELNAAYRVSHGLLKNEGSVVQRVRGHGIQDFYSSSEWGRTQFLFVPACAPFRADARFPALCTRLGHVAYWRQRGIWPDTFVRGSLDPAKLA